MISLTIHFGAGFIAGLTLSFIGLLFATVLLVRHILAHIKSRDSVVYRNSIIDAVATFLAEIFSHPAVVDAISRAVATGINRWIASPDARRALREVYDEVPKSEAVRKIGKAVPGYTKNFGLGVVDAFREVADSYSESKSKSEGDVSSKNYRKNV